VRRQQKLEQLRDKKIKSKARAIEDSSLLMSSPRGTVISSV
jgi:hypothetical protein